MALRLLSCVWKLLAFISVASESNALPSSCADGRSRTHRGGPPAAAAPQPGGGLSQRQGDGVLRGHGPPTRPRPAPRPRPPRGRGPDDIHAGRPDRRYTCGVPVHRPGFILPLHLRGCRRPSPSPREAPHLLGGCHCPHPTLPTRVFSCCRRSVTYVVCLLPIQDWFSNMCLSCFMCCHEQYYSLHRKGK